MGILSHPKLNDIDIARFKHHGYRQYIADSYPESHVF